MIEMLLIGVIAVGFILYSGARRNVAADSAGDGLGPHAARDPAADEDDGNWDDGGDGGDGGWLSPRRPPRADAATRRPGLPPSPADAAIQPPRGGARLP